MCTLQGALVDLDQAVSLDRYSAAALRCRGSTLLFLGDPKVSIQIPIYQFMRAAPAYCA